jgi:hypothetical protein
MEYQRCPACQAMTVAAVTPGGKAAVIDAAPGPEGTHRLIARDGREPMARAVLPASARLGRKDLRTVHACPAQAGQDRVPASGLWLIAKTPGDQPYPCVCHSRHGCKPRGANPDYCLCAGRRVEAHLPLACCARKTVTTQQIERTHDGAHL